MKNFVYALAALMVAALLFPSDCGACPLLRARRQTRHAAPAACTAVVEVCAPATALRPAPLSPLPQACTPVPAACTQVAPVVAQGQSRAGPRAVGGAHLGKRVLTGGVRVLRAVAVLPIKIVAAKPVRRLLGRL